MNNFSERLQHVLHSKKIKQRTLSELTGINQVTISRWKKGEFVPKDENIKRIAAATGCSLEWLRDGTGDMFPGAGNGNIDQGNIRVSNSSISQHRSTFGITTGAEDRQRQTPGEGRFSENDDINELMLLLQEYESPAVIKKMLRKYRRIKKDIDG